MMQSNFPISTVVWRLFLGLFLLLAPARAIAKPVAAEAKLNVLFITVDDMNWDSAGCFGCKVPDITPNIDRLASA